MLYMNIDYSGVMELVVMPDFDSGGIAPCGFNSHPRCQQTARMAVVVDRSIAYHRCGI